MVIATFVLGEHHSSKSRSPNSLQRRLDAVFRRHDDSKTRALFFMLTLVGQWAIITGALRQFRYLAWIQQQDIALKAEKTSADYPSL